MELTETKITDSLSTDEYHLLIAPALQVSAGLAARRGNPDLYSDMPAMLALITMVNGLCNCYGRAVSRKMRSDDATLGAARAGVCTMVLAESDLDKTEIRACIKALSLAWQQLVEGEVLNSCDERFNQVWQFLQDGRREAALKLLGRMALDMVESIDCWEIERRA